MNTPKLIALVRASAYEFQTCVFNCLLSILSDSPQRHLQCNEATSNMPSPPLICMPTLTTVLLYSHHLLTIPSLTQFSKPDTDDTRAWLSSSISHASHPDNHQPSQCHLLNCSWIHLFLSDATSQLYANIIFYLNHCNSLNQGLESYGLQVKSGFSPFYYK